jgi:signal transduction histidine kinase
MVSIFQRALFWRVYLTLLGGLALVAILSAVLWHWMLDQPMPTAVGIPGAALGALLPDPGAPQPVLAEAVRRMSAAETGRVTLVDPDGRILAAARAGRLLSPRAAEIPLVNVGFVASWRARLADGRTLRIDTPRRLRAEGHHMLQMLLGIAAVVGLAAYPAVSRLTRRLERLRASLDAWGGGRLDARAGVDGRDEIAAVASSFNAAADRVEGLLAAHKALLAHASHELRSPLTRLRLAVEIYAASPDPALRPAIEGDIAELDGLVEEILLASRLDHAPAATERETIDLLGLAAEEAARAGAILRKADPSQTAFDVQGSPRLLRRLIRNLVENAGKHGRPPVEIELARRDDPLGPAVAITVADQGPGIAEAERERVFEPFYRPRGHAESAGSWGLGLSIVRQIAERHGGTVACEAAPDGGGRFVAVLPVGRRG